MEKKGKIIMKIKTIILCAALMYATHVHASSSVDVQMYQMLAGDAENIVENSDGSVKLRIHMNNIYLYAQAENTSVRFGGQGGTDIQLFSGGIGARKELFDGFHISFDVGWYEPRSDNKPHNTFDTTLSEGLMLYLNKYLGMERTWDYYTLQYMGAFGGTINAEYSCQISKSWSIGICVGYRYLNLDEKIKGKDFGNTVGWWEIKQPRNFGGGIIAGTITYKF